MGNPLFRLSTVVLLSLGVSACSGGVTAGPPAGDLAGDVPGALAPEAAAASAAARPPPAAGLTVMTRNLYLGADILELVTSEHPVEATTRLWADVQATDFPSRAKVLADEVYWARPEVLALQEVTLYRSGPPKVCEGTASPAAPVASALELDFLDVLLRELRHRGLHYELAAQVTTMDTELCFVDVTRAGLLRDLRYTDRDVLLVRQDVRWRPATLPAAQPIPGFVPAPVRPGLHDRNGAVYAAALETGDPQAPFVPVTAYFSIAGIPDPIVSWRGWTAVEVERGGSWVRVFESHVEDQLDAGPELPADWFQLWQDAELVATLDAALAMAPLPTLLLGDFNVYRNEPPATPSRSYGFLTGDPFPFDPESPLRSPLQDAWTAVFPGGFASTWGFDPLLRSGELETILDLVLFGPGLSPTSVYRVGTEDRTPGGLHPSDHAGLVATFRLE